MTEADGFGLSWDEMTAASDRDVIIAIVGKKPGRPSRSGRVVLLARVLQAAGSLAESRAHQVAAAYIRAAPVHAASHVLWLMWSYSIRHLAPIALEARADVRALLLSDVERVYNYVGETFADELIEATAISRAIEARIAAETALAEIIR